MEICIVIQKVNVASYEGENGAGNVERKQVREAKEEK